jgi:hypothetical protein
MDAEAGPGERLALDPQPGMEVGVAAAASAAAASSTRVSGMALAV